jgi:hypothetical protein
MLLTLTTTHNPATDLGYLLHKNDSTAKKLLTFMSRHTADIAGRYIPWPI